MKIDPYLNFNGDCAEAFRLYERVLGGQIEGIMTFGESPMADEMPPEQRDLVLHASMMIDGQRLMASDAPPEHYEQPQGLFISLQMDDVAEADRIYQALSEGGRVIMPLEKTFWAEKFAMFHDRFGTPWMINFEGSAGEGG